MKSILRDKTGAVQYIALGIVILVMSAIAIPIVFSVMAGTGATGTTIDAQIKANIGGAGHPNPLGNTTYVFRNTTVTVLSTSTTVLGLNPLAALVAVAAGMISLLVGAFMVARPGGV
jgi:predicted membrane channel-forming protein YqfA (hemolysin III family)